MLGFIFKKFRKKDDQPKQVGEKLAVKLRNSSDKLSKFLEEKFSAAQDEFFVIKDKCGNLEETNYKLGLKHLEKGNLSEAIFRFRITKKFWPQRFDAYYHLAYSLALKQKYRDAEQVLQELLVKNSSYGIKAKELLELLNKAKSDKDEQKIT
jgi:tetratricopeptide (TPR) repeat protein